MAGHSKWANIKHRKAGQDAKRGRIFTRLIREIRVAARLGGGTVADNPRLRTAVDKALGANMPRDTIERAISRGAGGVDNDNLEELVYEGYGPEGVAVLCEVLTDNRNRTVAALRHGFTKFGGNLGASGSVAWLFRKSGILSFAAGCDEEGILEQALEAGADDVISNDDGSIDVVTTPELFAAVRDDLVAAGLEPANAEIAMLATTEVEMKLDGARKLLQLIEHLEELDDVRNVYTNANISAAVARRLEAGAPAQDLP